MGQKKFSKQNLTRANVIGTWHSRGGMAAALAAPAAALDLVEVRLDLLGGVSTSKLAELAQKFPLLVTARHPDEGGRSDISEAQRLRWLETALPFAALVDVELARFEAFNDLLSGEKALRVASFHDFSATPKLADLKKHLVRAKRLGADVFKVASQIRSATDLSQLLLLLEAGDGFPIAAMGMGPLGRASRLLLAASGSCLNYGWLHRPQVPGQFPALVLKDRFAEVGA